MAILSLGLGEYGHFSVFTESLTVLSLVWCVSSPARAAAKRIWAGWGPGAGGAPWGLTQSSVRSVSRRPMTLMVNVTFTFLTMNTNQYVCWICRTLSKKLNPIQVATLKVVGPNFSTSTLRP